MALAAPLPAVGFRKEKTQTLRSKERNGRSAQLSMTQRQKYKDLQDQSELDFYITNPPKLFNP